MKDTRMRTMRLTALLALVVLAACRGRTRAPRENFDPNTIYYEYQVTGQEGEDSVACRLQCRRGGPSGPTILLGGDTSVRLDDTPLTADSAGFSGYYYETQLPAAGFAGDHTWNVGGTKTSFSFHPFGIGELPATLKRGDLSFQLPGLEKDVRLHVLLVDTAWASNDLNAVFYARDGVLTVPADRLANVASGPVTLELSYDETAPLGGGRAGTQRVTYGLRRSFDLVD